ncbi:MAG: hypothetical protein ACTSW1_06740 [Candidatus Hodarchaeales archaeon]
MEETKTPTPIKISVISGPPGTGKTRSTLQQCNPNHKTVLSSYSHRLLKEFQTRLNEANIPNTHWQGIKLICPLYQSNQIITRIIDGGTPPRYVCNLCQKSNPNNRTCPYTQQFQNPENTLLCPATYLYTNKIRQYKPDKIFIDDVILQKRPLPTRPKLNHWIDNLKTYNILDNNITLNKILTNPRYYIDMIRNEIALRVSEETSNEIFLNHLFSVNPNDLYLLKKMYRVHGLRDQYAVPLIFQAFEHGVESDVTIIDAIPNREFLHGMAARYQIENPDYVIEYDFLEPFEYDTESKSEIIRVRLSNRKEAFYPKTSLMDPRTQERINNQIEDIIIAYGLQGKRFGLITHKSLVNIFCPRAEKRAYFGNLRGLNEFENLDALFIVGTYIPNYPAIQKDYDLFYARPPTTTESKKVKGEGRYYLDSSLENFSIMVGAYETYQAAHRCRPGLSKKKVFIWGVVPKWLKEEFEVSDLVKLVDNGRGGFSVSCRGDLYQYIKRVLEGSSNYSMRVSDLVTMILDDDRLDYCDRSTVYKLVNDVVEENEDIVVDEVIRLGVRGRPSGVIRLNRS